MFASRTVFAQLIDHLPPHEFHKCVERHGGNYKFRGFSCLDQFLCLAFAQLTFRESLRDIEACWRSVESKLYHMGFRGRVARPMYANESPGFDPRRLPSRCTPCSICAARSPLLLKFPKV